MNIMRYHFDGFVHDCNISSALEIDLRQSSKKPSIHTYINLKEDIYV